MNSTNQQEIESYILRRIEDLARDWDYTDPIGPRSLLFTELGFESLDAVVLCTSLQEHYQHHMPFAELFAHLGEQRKDLSIGELAAFVHSHVEAPRVDVAVEQRK